MTTSLKALATWGAFKEEEEEEEEETCIDGVIKPKRYPMLQF